MLRVLGEELGKFVARGVMRVKDFRGDLAGLDELLKEFFKEVERILPEKYSTKFEYSSELGKTLITRSKCPVYRIYPKWCEEGCLEFITAFAKTLNDKISVKRLEKQPESNYCKFEFSIE